MSRRMADRVCSKDSSRSRCRVVPRTRRAQSRARVPELEPTRRKSRATKVDGFRAPYNGSAFSGRRRLAYEPVNA